MAFSYVCFFQAAVVGFLLAGFNNTALQTKGVAMTQEKNTIQSMQNDFQQLRNDVGALADLDAQEFPKAAAPVLHRMVDMLETLSLQQVAGYQESAKAFQAIGDALKSIVKMVSPGSDEQGGPVQ